MFSVQQKRDISDAVQKILRATNHPELPPTGEIGFTLHVDGAGDWSWADIQNNGAVGDPGVNPHNELMASIPEEEGRGLIEKAEAQVPYAENLTPIMDLQQRVTAEIDQLKNRLTTFEDKDKIHRKLYSELRFGLDKLQDFLTPIIEDNLIANHDERLRTLEAPDPRATPDDFYKEMMENNLVTLKEDNASLHTRIDSLETAIKQLGTGQLLKKDPKKCPDCGVVEGDEHAPDCTALEVKNTIGDA